MITWFKFQGKQSDIELIKRLVGLDEDRAGATRQYTKKFLVVAKFNISTSEPEVRKATMYLDNGDIQVEGMTGKVSVSHWSVMNLPKQITDGN